MKVQKNLWFSFCVFAAAVVVALASHSCRSSSSKNPGWRGSQDGQSGEHSSYRYDSGAGVDVDDTKKGGTNSGGGRGQVGQGGGQGSENTKGAGGQSGVGADAALKDVISDSSVPKYCTHVVHIGDSLSATQESAIVAAYDAVNMEAKVDAMGGRAIRQPYNGDTGLVVVRRFLDEGFGGCWVIALGTNDAANIAAGADYTQAAVIDQMMQTIDATRTKPIMWVNTYTTNPSHAFYHNDNMVKWNNALEQAKSRWPNMRVYDWATYAKANNIHHYDGIHLWGKPAAIRHTRVAEAAKDLLRMP